MIVMPANNCKAEVHYWQGKYGGLGHLYAPGGERGPYGHMPYALDNGAFGAFMREEEFDAVAFCGLLEWAKGQEQKPLWVVVPDEVGEPEITLARWSEWAPNIHAEYGYKLALAVQDGMTRHDLDDLDPSPDVVFVGGTTKWKWSMVPHWCAAHPHIHVGRVNSPTRLYRCWELGVKSVDGTGWFRGDASQTGGLREFLERQSAGTLQKQVNAMQPLLAHMAAGGAS